MTQSGLAKEGPLLLADSRAVANSQCTNDASRWPVRDCLLKLLGKTIAYPVDRIASAVGKQRSGPILQNVTCRPYPVSKKMKFIIE